MTLKEIIDAFKLELEMKTGMQVLVMPQTLKNDTGHLELYFTGIEAAGESNVSGASNATEAIRISITYRTSGTHLKWIDRIMNESRKLEDLSAAGKLSFTVTLLPLEETEESRKLSLSSRWNRLERGRFEYPDNEDSSMPVSYTESFAVSINYPAYLITGGNGGINE